MISLTGTEEQKKYFFAQVLGGKRFGNGFSEKGTKNVLDLKTSVTGTVAITSSEGTKFYSTGALFADFVPVAGARSERKGWLAYIPKGTPGLTVIDDWSGFGQRTTASGTVVLESVRVPASHVVAGASRVRFSNAQRSDFTNHPGRYRRRHRDKAALDER